MVKIEPMTASHAGAVLHMMRTFYASAAVHTDGSEEVFRADLGACVGECPYLEGFVFTEDGAVVGYSMEARSFSTEYGRPCVWVEDLYLEPAYRGRGLAGEFFKFLEDKYPGCALRLEADPENAPALRAYRKSGFREMSYAELIKFT